MPSKNTASCVKPQLAYFEVLGWEGMKVFWEVCAYAKKTEPDRHRRRKRNDIGTTCEAYAEAYLHKRFSRRRAHSLALSRIGRYQSFHRALRKNDKGIFILVKTSNPSSGEIQDLPVGDEVVHEHVAQLVESWGMHHLGKTNLSCVGAVAGATYPEEMKYLRTLMPHIPFLIPGYGAQGGTAVDVKHGFIPDGTGTVVNASRSIIFASKGKDWKEAAAKATLRMAREIKEALK